MRNEPTLPAAPVWAFHAADGLLVAAGAIVFWQHPFTLTSSLVVAVTFGLGAVASVLPHWSAEETADPKPSEPTGAAGMATGAEEDDALAETAVLAWKILKRAQRDPEAHRVILRNAERMLESLARCGIELVSYHGRKIDVGSNVQILDAIPGEYNRVMDESDPQVQRHGRLLRRALVTVGNGQPPVDEAAASAGTAS